PRQVNRRRRSTSGRNTMRIKFRTRSTHMLASRMAVLSLILIFAAQFCADRSLLGQDAAYLVTELTSEDGAQVPSKLNNLGGIVASKDGDKKGAPQHTHSKHT